MEPRFESIAVTTHRLRIARAPFEQRLLIASLVENGIGHGDSTDRVVGETAFVGEKFESFSRGVSKLETRPDDVSNDGS